MTWEVTPREDTWLLVSHFGYKAAESGLNLISLQMVKCLGPLFTKHALGGSQLRGVMLTPALTC